MKSLAVLVSLIISTTLYAEVLSHTDFLRLDENAQYNYLVDTQEMKVIKLSELDLSFIELMKLKSDIQANGYDIAGAWGESIFEGDFLETESHEYFFSDIDALVQNGIVFGYATSIRVEAYGTYNCDYDELTGNFDQECLEKHRGVIYEYYYLNSNLDLISYGDAEFEI